MFFIILLVKREREADGKPYTFDKIFKPDTRQEQVFEESGKKVVEVSLLKNLI